MVRVRIRVGGYIRSMPRKTNTKTNNKRKKRHATYVCHFQGGEHDNGLELGLGLRLRLGIRLRVMIRVRIRVGG
jgi:hypothetical protein